MVSKELITIYKCDRCGKQMKSQYATLTLKLVGQNFSVDDYVDKDLCIDCYDKINRLMKDDKTMIVGIENLSNWVTTKDSNVKDFSPLERGTYVTWTGNDGLHRNEVDPLNKHLDVTCV